MSIRPGILFASFLSLSSPLWAASDLASLQAEIDAKAAEIGELRSALNREERAVQRLQTERETLQQDAPGLQQRKDETLAALKAQFARVVEDPGVDISAAQQAYRDAFMALDGHAEAVAAKAEQIAAGEQRMRQARAAAEQAGTALATLRAGLDQARAERLLNELNVVGEITLSNTISCQRDETIAACIERGEDQARQLARERFARQLLSAVTEADLVAQHSDGDGTQPTLIDSTVTNSGFRGQGDYFVELSARLRNDTSQAQACSLLGLTAAQCRGEAPPSDQQTTGAEAPAAEPDAAPEADVAQEAAEAPADDAAPAAAGPYRLTVRSNVYYDEVFIDGVAYGSTKLDVMLPPGDYELEVRKPGHSSYRQRVSLTGNRVVTAELGELAQ
jgi:hypothetical protein